MSRYTTVEAVSVTQAGDPLDDTLRVRQTYSVQLDDRCTTVEAVMLSAVEIERRSYDGTHVGSVKFSSELLLPLYHVLGDVLTNRQLTERPAASEVDEVDPTENPGNGESFTIAENVIVGGHDITVGGDDGGE